MSLRTELQSGEADIILNTIDGLRSLGIGNILELPQIIVCGDQSSGKSSVLNAVSTLKFPIKDGLCTRFATEVIMRPGNLESVVASIVPGAGRSLDQKRALEAFRRGNVKMEDIESLITQATDRMGIDPENPHGRRFSNDILRFEVTGPNQPSLTLVDLPGLFSAPSKYQTSEDTESVQRLVLQYMRNKRSVILAVISAKSEFVLQSVTKYSREVDPRGIRTLGIITKPDKLDQGSEGEKKYLELAENRMAFFHRGWHVLVNRDHSTRDFTQAQRDDAEQQFLSKGIWTRVPPNHKGVFKLKLRLSGLLRDLILDELPHLIRETEDEYHHCETRLSKLGISRASADDRRQYLARAAQRFNDVMGSCISGSYDGAFFKQSHGKDTHIEQRLRAVVQDTLMEYSDDMQCLGHAKHIIDDPSATGTASHPHLVSRENFENEVMDLMKHARGRELLGTHNPIFVSELFRTQSEPWVDLTEKFRAKILKSVNTTIDLVLDYVTDEHTKMQLKKTVIKPSLDRLIVALDEMIRKLLAPRSHSHPITYSRRLADSMERVKQASAEKLFAEKWERAISGNGQVVQKDTLRWLLQQQVVLPEASLKRFAASEAIDVMRAYYKIAKETLVDSFSSLAIEDCLITNLPDILSPDVVSKLDDDTINEIARETESAAWERSETKDRLELCDSALTSLKKIEDLRIPGMTSFDRQDHFNSPKAQAVDGVDGSDQQLGTDLSKLDSAFSDREDGLLKSNDVLHETPTLRVAEERVAPNGASEGTPKSTQDDEWYQT